MNALKEYINFEKNNINVFAKEVLSDYYDEELFNKLLNTYIENRYYNFYGDKNCNLEDTIFDHLKKKLMKLIEGVDEETKNKISEMYVLFNYILCFDGVNNINDITLVKLLCDYRKSLFGINDAIFQKNITKLISSVNEKREKFFNFFNSEEFYLNEYSTSKEDVFDIEIRHNIEFPKLYSEYAIERVFNTLDINEDKLLVEYYLITKKIIENIKGCIFNRYYMLDLAPSLFEDKDKLYNLLSIAEDDCFKNQTIMKINYENYAKYTDIVKNMIRDGYKFAIFIDDDINKDDFILFNIFDYIVVNKDSKYCKDMEDNDKIIIVNDR